MLAEGDKLGPYQILARIEALEQVVAVSRAPIFIGLLGSAYNAAGRTEDGNRLMRELEERRSRGEYISSMSILNILVGAGDIPGVRRALSESIAEPCPAFTMRLTSPSQCDRHSQRSRNQSHACRVIWLSTPGWLEGTQFSL